MTQNSLYPGFVKLKYSANGHTHYQVLPVIPDTPASPGIEPYFALADGPAAGMNILIDEYIALIDNLYTDTASFILAEFWRVPTIGSDPVFEYVYEIGQPGLSATAPTLAGQLCISLRTSAGGILKLYYMETVSGLAVKDDYPFANSAINALTNYLIGGSTGWIVGRDGGYPIAGLRALTKVNDALRKKYVLNV